MSGDDGDRKSRGLKHVKNKKKYGRSRALPTAAPPSKSKSVPKLETNWDRYESETIKQHQINSSTDFAILSSAPLSYGSHFQFKSDKEIDLSPVKTHELFKLDLNLLNLSLSTIPFHIRNDIADSYFTQEEILVFNRTSSDNKEKYTHFLKNIDNTPLEELVFSVNSNIKKNEIAVHEGESRVQEIPKQATPRPLIREITPSQPSEEIKKTSASDLEEWLDDVLDD